jgi:hypothetical protein
MSAKRGNDFLTGLRAVKEENAVVRPTEAKVAAPAAAIIPERTIVHSPTETGPAPRQKGREGKVSITQWVDPVVRKQLAQISLDEDKDQYQLINEALNLLFEKYGRSTIA